MSESLARRPDLPEADVASNAVTSLRPLLTAAEAYPALEHAFLNARSEIVAGFRIFDLRTKLRSAEACEIGTDWFDLLLHTLQRGVDVRLVISDFDPIAGPDLHRTSWRTRRQLIAVQELSTNGTLSMTMDMHDARLGLIPRLIFFPVAYKRLRDLVRRINDMPLARRKRFMQEAVRLKSLVAFDGQHARARLTLPNIYPATHHQKLAVFDSTSLYIGGLDLNERRFDTPGHAQAAEHTWYDLQAFAEGPVAAAARTHLCSFLETTAGSTPPAPPAPGFLRTLSSLRAKNLSLLAPRTRVKEIETAHFDQIKLASDLIYFETQFLRHIPLARFLAKRAADNPALKLIVILPAAPEDAAFDGHRGSDVKFGEYLQTRCIRILRRAFGPDRLIIASPVQPRPSDSDGRDVLAGAPLIYFHAKLSIFDRTAAIVSSANLNGRSMKWDTEAGIKVTALQQVDALRNRVMTHWIPDTPLDNDAALFEHWAAQIDANTQASPADRKGFLVHYDSAPARALAMPLPCVPDELV